MVNWYTNTQRFYGLSTSSDDNVETVEFESGKKRYILKNSSPKLNHTFSFLLRSATEEKSFFNWYKNTLLSRTQTVGLYDLITKDTIKEYRVTDEPTISGSQYPKEVTLTVQEE